MAGTLTISTLSDGTNSTSSTNCIQGSAKAWVRYNGSTQAVLSSYNVSSVTYSGTGLYIVNMTNAMVDTNYAVTTGGGGIVDWGTTTLTSSSFNVRNFNDAGTFFNTATVSVSVFR